MTYEIDAKGKRLGRLASEIAVILQGKRAASYEPRREGSDRVIVKNVQKLTVGGRKASEKRYFRHAGPLGHLKERKFQDVFAKDPAWVLRHAVRLMLPKNRLAARRLKRLMIEK